jgi:hypothetical protein
MIMEPLEPSAAPLKEGDPAWVRHDRFLQKKRIGATAGETVRVGGRPVPRHRIIPARTLAVPDEVLGLRLWAEALDYRVWGAYGSSRISDMGLSKGKVLGLLIEHLDCDGVSGRYFPGRGQSRADVFHLLWELESGRLSGPDASD